MKQFLKLATSIIICVGSLAQATGAFATITAKCPDNDQLKRMSVDRGTPDSQGVTWVIGKDLNANGGVIPASFSGWEIAGGFFQPKSNNPQYTPYLHCSVGDFHIAGFFPVGSYKSCTLEGNTIEQEKYYQCKDAKSCELICS